MLLFMKLPYRTLLLQIALAPSEFGAWGPLINESNAYTVDSTKGKSQNVKSVIS
jgi:hypothetical protein